MLICNRQVTESQLQALDELAELCKKNDGGLPALYRHILIHKRDAESNVFFYQNDKLIAFLGAYFFYTNACEISVMVAPTHRRQGIATQLVETILPLVIAKNLDIMVFSTPTALHDHWLPNLGFSYQQTEYHMQREGYDPILRNNPKLVIRKATEEDVDTLATIDKACFQDSFSSMPPHFYNLLNDNNYSLFIALHQNKPVGKAHIHWQENLAFFSDIAILPEFQGQGLGSELLSFCINQALTQGKAKIALDVETSNRHALDLYLRHGFKIVLERDYWYIPVAQLQKMLAARKMNSNLT
ncbi:GNAT family N-acetyltransferase [Legionella spiritensis]|uniref:N-acetyltransferase domain-containing protein n=1 Tax=Legionella spiritensis TaxID=452 RepID=A0A0W0YZD2_LEGSP|nr:GNAT family N-acetyltransferase [Legionella spiritensis]KTD62256.1 hypothetical protein Lspi_2106 [Legionella spiritensis]SNV28815.1 N-terminal GNAT family acetyltransferase [Legionella spiritensis]